MTVPMSEALGSLSKSMSRTSLAASLSRLRSEQHAWRSGVRPDAQQDGSGVQWKGRVAELVVKLL
jgi:hypothetical protein